MCSANVLHGKEIRPGYKISYSVLPEDRKSDVTARITGILFMSGNVGGSDRS